MIAICFPLIIYYDGVKWKHCPRCWPFVRGIHRWPVDSTHKGQRRGALVFCLTCAWTNGWTNNRDASDLGLHSAHYDVTVMILWYSLLVMHAQQCRSLTWLYTQKTWRWHSYSPMSEMCYRTGTRTWQLQTKNQHVYYKLQEMTLSSIKEQNNLLNQSMVHTHVCY